MILRSSARAKGSSFEKNTAVFAQDLGFPDAHRVVKTGARDEGDVWLPIGDGMVHVLQCKNCVTTELAEWVDDAEEQARNVNASGRSAISFAVVHKRRGKGDMAEQYVTTKLGEYLANLAGAQNARFWRAQYDRVVDELERLLEQHPQPPEAG